MAMYQDRIFAFTPKGELIQLPKGATPVDFAYAVHTDLGDQTVGAKINGRVMPLRTPLDNGDQVEILVSKAQHPQPAWLSYVVTGKARAKIRRWVKSKEREETVALGRKIFDEIVAAPAGAKLGWEAIAEALRRLHLPNDEALMEAIALKRIDDVAVMEALMPGSATEGRRQAAAAAHRDLDQGADPRRRLPARRMLPPDPRRPDRRPAPRGRGDRGPYRSAATASPTASTPTGSISPGATNRTAAPRGLSVVIKNEPGSLAVVAGILGSHGANIVSMDQTVARRQRSTPSISTSRCTMCST